mmetsp:Transcript_55153/g.146336  ORF Transcript_55153/g.146336 Transcript_55153/m.146336 type:complete len:638 (+) Transcript_55153:396-2309(+)
MLENGKLPKVPLTSDWLIYKNFETYDKEPTKASFFNVLCTPYMYRQYDCIFGLTGSVGGIAERDYIRKTYKGVVYDVPQFLYTCTPEVEGKPNKQPAVNKGVTLTTSEPDLQTTVINLVLQHQSKVPVLVICESRAQMDVIFKLLKNRVKDDGSSAPMVQMLRELDDKGNIEGDIKWAKVIGDATARVGVGDKSMYHVTVTDVFGGRGHDFNCDDKLANHNGGMLVIATSVPNKREWIQWIGRTARQDRPGQYHVVLNMDSPLFQQNSKLKRQINDMNDGNEQIDRLLLHQNEGLDALLDKYAAEQARGAWLNELCQEYYKQPNISRDYKAPWPNRKAQGDDQSLREILSRLHPTGSAIQSLARDKLKLQLDGQIAIEWDWPPEKPFGLEGARQPMAVLFLIDRTFGRFRAIAVKACLDVFNDYLKEEDKVGYKSLGGKWVFKMTDKRHQEQKLAAKIKASDEKDGSPDTYNEYLEMSNVLKGIPETHSKWLIAITDTCDFKSSAENPAKHWASTTAATSTPGDRAVSESKARQVAQEVAKIKNLHFVLIDCSGIGKNQGRLRGPNGKLLGLGRYDDENQKNMWPTWDKNTRTIMDTVGASSHGAFAHHIPADSPEAIREAFDEVANLMQASGGAAG